MNISSLIGVTNFVNSGTPPVATTLDPAAKGSNITLTGGNLISTVGGFIGNCVLSTTSNTSGVHGFEVTIGTDNSFIGIGNASTNLNDEIGVDTNSWGIYAPTGAVYMYHAGTGFTSYSLTAGDKVLCVIDFPNSKIKYYLNGVIMTSVEFTSVTGTLYAVVGGYPPASVTVNFNSGTWSFPIGGVSSW